MVDLNVTRKKRQLGPSISVDPSCEVSFKTKDSPLDSNRFGSPAEASGSISKAHSSDSNQLWRTLKSCNKSSSRRRRQAFRHWLCWNISSMQLCGISIWFHSLDWTDRTDRQDQLDIQGLAVVAVDSVAPEASIQQAGPLIGIAGNRCVGVFPHISVEFSRRIHSNGCFCEATEDLQGPPQVHLVTLTSRGSIRLY